MAGQCTTQHTNALYRRLTSTITRVLRQTGTLPTGYTENIATSTLLTNIAVSVVPHNSNALRTLSHQRCSLNTLVSVVQTPSLLRQTLQSQLTPSINTYPSLHRHCINVPPSPYQRCTHHPTIEASLSQHHRSSYCQRCTIADHHANSHHTSIVPSLIIAAASRHHRNSIKTPSSHHNHVITNHYYNTVALSLHHRHPTTDYPGTITTATLFHRFTNAAASLYHQWS